MPPEQASILGCMNGKRDQLVFSMSNGSYHNLCFSAADKDLLAESSKHH